jgi:tetratricopeptide (TPR) repeat protein
VRLAAVALVLALWLLQPSSQPGASDLEAAYRANNRGVALLEQFSYDEAAVAFRDALRLAPSLDPARLNLAIADFYAGRTADAASGARAAAERMPANPTAHFMRGLIAKSEDRLDESVAAFTRVLALDPRDPGTLVALGQIHLQERRIAEALALFERAIAAEPFNVTAAYNLALALTRAGRAEEGRAAMQRFERLRDSAYGVTYAQTYLSQGRYGEALASTGAETGLVNPNPPAVKFVAADVFPRRSGPAPAGAGAITLADADSDGDPDAIECSVEGVRLLRNTRGQFSDDTARARIPALAGAVAAIAGDYDNDTRPDIFVLTASGRALLHQTTDGTFEDVTTPAGLPAPPPGAATAAFADIDHDGDLDILAAGDALQLLRNNGNGTFTDITAQGGGGALPGRALAVAPTDFDGRRDIDILVATASGVALFRNMRDGTFRDAASDVGLPASGRFTAMAVGDVNKDGFPDVFLGTATGANALALSDGSGRYAQAAAPGDAGLASAAQLLDYDNDGLLDLVAARASGLSVHRNLGNGKWDRTVSAESGRYHFAAADVDSDGDRDVVLREADGRLLLLRNDGGDLNASLRVRLTSRVSNRSAIGAKIEMRAGSLRQAIELSSASPAIAPADAIFGLGSRSADVIRVLWPSGILQAETAVTPARGSRDVAITELDRKPSSCPYLFAWNGRGFAFVTDFMGGGEMGAWMGPGAWNHPDPDEYVRIRGDQLRERDGRYDVRVTNELEEALFVDRVQLIAVDHAADVEVYPDEGLRAKRVPFKLHQVRNARPPARATDEHGHDVLPRLAALDRRYVDDFATLPVRGYAAPHVLDLDLGPGGDSVLLLTGWTDYAFSNDNVAASQQGLAMSLPLVQVRNARGAWTTVLDNVGFPVGRPQTLVVDLTGRFLSRSREVRIMTNMRIYWDQVRVGARVDTPVRLTRLDPLVADLRWRGFSAEATHDEPYTYDYARVATSAPWMAPAGRYTREGDVRPLLRAVDDMFVIARPGDELVLSFEAARAHPPKPRSGEGGRTFLLYSDGFSKEMNPRSAIPDTVSPLPFHGMSGYPYPPSERYPDTNAHREYQRRYNTRIVPRAIPSLEVHAALQRPLPKK